jgi:DNA-binding XRE family transcriptional regulator
MVVSELWPTACSRKKKLTHFQRQEALARLEAGETQSVIAKTYGVDRATIRRLQS